MKKKLEQVNYRLNTSSSSSIQFSSSSSAHLHDQSTLEERRLQIEIEQILSAQYQLIKELKLRIILDELQQNFDLLKETNLQQKENFDLLKKTLNLTGKVEELELPISQEFIQKQNCASSDSPSNASSVTSPFLTLPVMSEPSISSSSSSSFSSPIHRDVPISSIASSFFSLPAHGLTSAVSNDERITILHDEKQIRCDQGPAEDEVGLTAIRMQGIPEQKEPKNDRSVISKLFPCSDCGKKFPIKSRLNCHMRTHNGEKPFICSGCGREFADRTNCRRHVRRVHEGEKPYQCNVSGCYNKYVLSDNLKKHQEKVHGPITIPYKKKRIRCNQGSAEDKVGLTAIRMQGIPKQKEPKNGSSSILKSFPGSDYEKKFPIKSKLTSHVITQNGEKSYVCNECNRKFLDRSNFKRHMRRIHTGEKLYQCNVVGCKRKYVLSDNLKKHREKVHCLC